MEKTLSWAMGLQLPGSEGGPSFGIGEILLNFKASGKVLSLILLLIQIANLSIILGKILLKTLLLTPSGPQEVLFARVFASW